ncbi:MAG: hypothetical protein J0L99_16210 [Chitinophagales bacterium]|nr:hypothetical protein [Chitinophagales bacterium]
MSKKLFLLPLLLLSVVLFTPGCGEEDPCKNVECGANGTCFEGACVCNEGFEGSGCDTEWSAKFVTTYNGTDVCANGTFDYDQAITRVSESTVLLNDLGGTVYDITANISRINANDAGAEKISWNVTSAGLTFKGEGTITGTTVTGSYTIANGGTITDNCSFTWTKK